MTNSHYEAINQAMLHNNAVERFLFTPDNDKPIIYSDSATWRGYKSWHLAATHAPQGSFMCVKLAIDIWYFNASVSSVAAHFEVIPEQLVPKEYKAMALLLSS